MSTGSWRSWWRPKWQSSGGSIFSHAGQCVYQEYVRPGLPPAPYLGEGGSFELQISFIRPYLLYPKGREGYPGSHVRRPEKRAGFRAGRKGSRWWSREPLTCTSGTDGTSFMPSEIALDGTGDLYDRFEKLQRELEEMGMFAPEYKGRFPDTR